MLQVASLLQRSAARAFPAATQMATLATSAATGTVPAPRRIAVVGGGIAGLSAALAAARAGDGRVAVTVLDLGSRGPGGRLASRQQDHPDVGTLSFDHGAQLVTAIGSDFRRQVDKWRAEGVVAEWTGSHGRITKGGRFEARPSSPPPPGANGPGSPGQTGFCGSLTGLPLWVGMPTNNALAQHMAAQLQALPGAQLLSGVAVQSAARASGGCGCGSSGAWQLRGSRVGRAAVAEPAAPEQQEDLGSYDAVVLADAMPLLPGSAGHVAGLEATSSSLGQLARSVQVVAPEPCFALMVAFAEPLQGMPFDSASIEAGPWQWVANNSSKPGRPGTGSPQCWVALTTSERARQLLERRPLSVGGKFNPQTQQYQADVAAELLADFRALLQPWVQGPLPEPAYSHAQRWGRAFVPEPLGTEFLFLPAQRLALCGDACTGSSVEAAWRSGRAAGDAVARMLLSAA